MLLRAFVLCLSAATHPKQARVTGTENAGSTVCGTLVFGANNPSRGKKSATESKYGGYGQKFFTHLCNQQSTKDPRSTTRCYSRCGKMGWMPLLQKDVSARGDS